MEDFDQSFTHSGEQYSANSQQEAIESENEPFQS